MDLNSVDNYKLNIICRVYMNQGLRLFRLYETGVFPKKDWDLRAGEIKQIINGSEFGKEFTKNNRVFDDIWKSLEKLEVDPNSKFE